MIGKIDKACPEQLQIGSLSCVELALGRSTCDGLTDSPVHQSNVSDSVCQLQQPASLETRFADGEKLSDSVRQLSLIHI